MFVIFLLGGTFTDKSLIQECPWCKVCAWTAVWGIFSSCDDNLCVWISLKPCDPSCMVHLSDWFLLYVAYVCVHRLTGCTILRIFCGLIGIFLLDGILHEHLLPSRTDIYCIHWDYLCRWYISIMIIFCVISMNLKFLQMSWLLIKILISIISLHYLST